MTKTETEKQQQSGEAQNDPDAARAAIKENYGKQDDGQIYNDRSKMDFDPADGLYSGTVVDGNSEIEGPHENQEYVGEEPSEDEVKAAAENIKPGMRGGIEQEAAEGAEAARATSGSTAAGTTSDGLGADDPTAVQERAAETEHAAARQEPADEAAGQEIDSGAGGDASMDASGEDDRPMPGPR